MSASKDLTGQKFGILVVIEPAGNNPARHKLWRCACSCAGQFERVVAAHDLTRGDAKSCGCLRGRPGGVARPPLPRPVRPARPARPPRGAPKATPRAAPKMPVKDPARAFTPSVCLAPVDALTPTGTVRRSVERMLRQYGAARY